MPMGHRQQLNLNWIWMDGCLVGICCQYIRIQMYRVKPYKRWLYCQINEIQNFYPRVRNRCTTSPCILFCKTNKIFVVYLLWYWHQNKWQLYQFSCKAQTPGKPIHMTYPSWRNLPETGGFPSQRARNVAVWCYFVVSQKMVLSR